MATIPSKSRQLPKPGLNVKKPIIQRRLNPSRPYTSGKLKVTIPQYNGSEGYTKIALIQPASWGDNINSTLMFKPLKEHYGNMVLDVYTAEIYASAFANNPYVNRLVAFPAPTKEKALHLLHVIPPLIQAKGYDKIFCPHPMINGDKWTSIRHGELGTNLINAWVRALEEAGIDYKMPLETVLSLTPDEVANVNAFCSLINMNSRNILMEVEGLSGQTYWNHHWTERVGKHLLRGDTNLFLSRRQSGGDVAELERHAPGRIHFVGGLSIRECAELFNRCQMFFSVSSGLSNACNTNWCRKDVKWIETINSDAVSSAPIRREGKIFWTDNNLDHFMGMLTEQGI